MNGPEDIEARLERWRALAGRDPERRLKHIAEFQKRRFAFDSPPVEAPARFLINGKPVCTPGNLTAIIAQAKAGKSAFIGALAAARFAVESGNSECDLLGVSVPSDASGKVLWIDTEQSAFDFDANVRRSIRRAGLQAAPACLEAYGLAGTPAPILRSLLLDLAWHTYLDGVFAVIIDGIADLCADVNDAEECNALVAELHDAAIKYNCPIVCVLHENPTQTTGKARGHLGSQLERKAESNLRLSKADEVTVVFSEKMRRAPILEKDGPRFRWCNDAGMHVSVPAAGAGRDAEAAADLRDLAGEVFGTDRLRYADACVRIEKARRVGEKAGEKWFTRMKKAGVIRNVGMGWWEVAA